MTYLELRIKKQERRFDALFFTALILAVVILGIGIYLIF